SLEEAIEVTNNSIIIEIDNDENAIEEYLMSYTFLFIVNKEYFNSNNRNDNNKDDDNKEKSDYKIDNSEKNNNNK
ncbi:35473_t:CDS:1, partial [Racocetra persica]